MKQLILILFLLLALPFASAQSPEINPTKTTKAKVEGKEYGTIEQWVDRITAIFTAKIERKQALQQKIMQRRAEHVQFLIDNGKTEQATRFAEGSIKLNQTIDSQIVAKREQLAKLTAKGGN